MADWILQKYKINKIFSSPLKRASQTANILSEQIGVDIVYDDDLIEWQNGLIAGMPRDDARKKYPRSEVKYPHTVIYEQESDILPVTSCACIESGDTGVYEWRTDRYTPVIIHVNQQRHWESLHAL